MCDRLGQLRDAVGRYAAGFDPSLLSVEQASGAVAEAAAIEKMAATIKGLAAARAASGGAWRNAGDRSAAHHLARTTGTSVGQAGDVLETARRLERLPAAAAAARAGHLSAQQAAAVADAAALDAASEEHLVAKARTSSLAELREECARVKAAARPDAEARRKAIHDERYLRSWADAEGAWNLKMRDNPEVGAEVMAAVNAIRDRLFRSAREQGREEPTEAYAADALAELARTGGADGSTSSSPTTARSPRSRAKVIVRVDLPALLRGQVGEGEVCELAGFGPIAVSAIRDLIDTAHRTVFDLLDRLCTHHHDLKSLDGWALIAGHGKRPFVPPEDPRHPPASERAA